MSYNSCFWISLHRALFLCILFVLWAWILNSCCAWQGQIDTGLWSEYLFLLSATEKSVTFTPKTRTLCLSHSRWCVTVIQFSPLFVSNFHEIVKFVPNTTLCGKTSNQKLRRESGVFLKIALLNIRHLIAILTIISIWDYSHLFSLAACPSCGTISLYHNSRGFYQSVNDLSITYNTADCTATITCSNSPSTNTDYYRMYYYFGGAPSGHNLGHPMGAFSNTVFCDSLTQKWNVSNYGIYYYLDAVDCVVYTGWY